MFAAELTHAIAPGEDVAHRLEVLREYMKTWGVLAEHALPVMRTRT